MVNFRVYADRNYWTTTGWKDDAVSNSHQGELGGEVGGVGQQVGVEEEQGPAAGFARQAVAPGGAALVAQQADEARRGLQCADFRGDGEGMS